MIIPEVDRSKMDPQNILAIILKYIVDNGRA